ncbi:MAG: hypothetical protein CMH56_03095 [Myxococcales bacterium]|nr:hypothetical protein [Myxococcales bacterium]
MKRLKSPIRSPRRRLRNWVQRRTHRALERVKHQMLLGPDITRWLNRLLKANELTPEQRTRLAHSGAWITAPITTAQNILAGLPPPNKIGTEKGLQVFAETLCEIDPAILHRYWPGRPKDLERIRTLLARLAGRPIVKVLAMSND